MERTTTTSTLRRDQGLVCPSQKEVGGNHLRHRAINDEIFGVLLTSRNQRYEFDPSIEPNTLIDDTRLVTLGTSFGTRQKRLPALKFDIAARVVPSVTLQVVDITMAFLNVNSRL